MSQRDPMDINPFEYIALSLSGGGFRAAAFSLGSLKLLDEVKILDNVHMLSTVSGGTITGLYYAVNAKKGKSFNNIFQGLYKILKEDEIVNEALKILLNKEIFVTSGRQNPILAFAEAYNRRIFAGEKFGILWEGPKNKCIESKKFHLKEMIFNATDFESGIAFRFWKSAGRVRIGNRYNSLTQVQARNIRVADILATSSCFPGGFEPIGLPSDFQWQSKTIYEAIRERLKFLDVPLMDGGVYDNQGMDSLLMANSNNREYLKKHPITPGQPSVRQLSSLFIMVDVATAQRGFFKMPDSDISNSKSATLEDKYIEVKSKVKTYFKIKQIVVPAGILFSLIFTSLGIWGLAGKNLPIFISVLLFFQAISTFILTLILRSGVRKIDALKNLYLTKVQPEILKLQKKFPDIFEDGVESIGNLSLNRIIDMLEMRAKSVFAMTAGIFMKRIRSQGYEDLFENEIYENRCIASIIDDYKKKYPSNLPYFLKSQKLKRIASKAVEMPTTLWFRENKDKLKYLVASGRFTLCYNLLKFIYNHLGGGSKNSDLHEITKRLKKVWNKTEKDPFYDINI